MVQITPIVLSVLATSTFTLASHVSNPLPAIAQGLNDAGQVITAGANVAGQVANAAGQVAGAANTISGLLPSSGGSAPAPAERRSLTGRAAATVADDKAKASKQVDTALHPYLETCKSSVAGKLPIVKATKNNEEFDVTELSSTCMTGIKELQSHSDNNDLTGPQVISVNETITGPNSVHLSDVPASLKAWLMKAADAKN